MPRTKTSFKKGRSGNPGGRPRTIAQVQILARRQTARAVRTLTAALEATKLFGADCVEHPDYRVRVAAAEALLSRAWGTPVRAEVTAGSSADEARILSLQAQKLEAETRLLERKIAAEETAEGTGDPATDDAVDQMMRVRFGGVKHYPFDTPEEH